MKRIDYFDIAKGLGIILVVIGHLDSTCVHTIIYYFHMPLFFFISGIFYDPSHDFLLKKIKQAFIPIFVFSAISFPIKFIERSFLQEHVYFNLSYLTFQFYNIPLWFLISLFTIAILFYFVDITCSKRIKIFVFCSICIIGLFIAEQKKFFPFYISQSLMSFVFFMLGSYLHKYHPKKKHQKYIHTKKCMLLSTCCIMYAMYRNAETDISGLILDKNPFLFVMPALSGIFVILYISKLLSKSRNTNTLMRMANTILKYLGRNSLFIFGLHWPFITVLQKILSYFIANNTSANIVIFLLIITFSLNIGFILSKRYPSFFHYSTIRNCYQ